MDNRKYNMNCLDWRHPIRSIKRAYNRITKGYCSNDVWNWNYYMAQLIHDTLMYLAANHEGTMVEYADRDAEYTEKLEQVAMCILRATNFDEMYDNPFREDYYKDLENVIVERNGLNFENKDKHLFKHYWFVEQRNSEKAKKNLKEAFDWIVEHWFGMGD